MKKENKNKYGDCFQSAYRFITESNWVRPLVNGTLRLCHGVCVGNGGEVAGRTFVHAWVEDADTVWDYSNGNKVQIPKFIYYAVGRVSDVRRYTRRHAMNNALESGHYGYWDEDLFNPVMAQFKAICTDKRPKVRDNPKSTPKVA